MTTPLLRHARFALVLGALILGGTACAAEAPVADIESPKEPVTSAAPPSSAPTADAGGSNRSGVLLLAETPFQAFNGDARWEGDDLVLALDGDVAEESEAKFACGILNGFLQEGERARLEFPNGGYDCAAE